MLFNSFAFLFVFLPISLAVYFALARLGAPRLANVSLVLSSIAFYGYWRYEIPGGEAPQRMWGYLLLLCASTSLNYVLGALLQKHSSKKLLIAGIAANLGVLAYFKYLGFGIQVLADLTGWKMHVPTLVLPLAISFYTFTQIAFIVDAYRGAAAEMSFWRYCLFVFFFPHLIAGPIVHHSELMPQFAEPEAKRWQSPNVIRGLCWLSLGLFKKVAIADSCAPLANALFSNAAGATSLEAWCGVLAYAFQLYFDFSGYSDMAIGLGLLFNVRLPDNFNAPYRSLSIVDFWRRWHITLSRFLRDYLYIPLGGNRRGGARRYANLLITMVLGGIWHGAGWTFLIWGAYHGLLLVFCHLWQKIGRPLPSGPARLVTFVAVLIGWVFFRAGNLEQAAQIVRLMFDPTQFRLDGLVTGLQLEHVAWLSALLVFVNLAPTTKEWVESQELNRPQVAFAALIFSASLLFIRNIEFNFTRSEFIYFQF